MTGIKGIIKQLKFFSFNILFILLSLLISPFLSPSKRAFATQILSPIWHQKICYNSVLFD